MTMKIEEILQKDLGLPDSEYYKGLDKSKLWAITLKSPDDKNRRIDNINIRNVTKNKNSSNYDSLAPFKKIDKSLLKMKQHKDLRFHNIMKMILFFGQCIGLNPVAGIFKEDVSRLRFTMNSLAFWYSILLCLGQGIATVLSFFRLFWMSPEYQVIGFIFFNGSVFLNSILFFRIAKVWPALVREVESTELFDPITDQKLWFKCNMVAGIVAASAFLEHILSMISRFAELVDCFPNVDNMYQSYIESTFPWLFEVKCPFSLPLGVLLQIMNFTSTLNWNYSDMFLICISYYLTSRFEQLNKKIIAAQGKYLPPSFWRTQREKYNRICQLVRYFDGIFSIIIFTSFSSNLFFICVQLYHTLGHGIKHGLAAEQCLNFPSGLFGGYERAIYLIFSVGLLMSRSIAVSVVAARVHSATLVPAPALYSVPSPAYCVEIQRFLDQIHGTTVALTGLRFFNVTRGVLLSVAGTIVTYELVLLQFDQTHDSSNSKLK